jgi:hypothetical protein
MPGIATLAAEVTNISPLGLWLLVDEEEFLLPFEDFPWFRSATVAQLSQVERLSEDHLYWPALDVDLSVASIRDPASFPLVAHT